MDLRCYVRKQEPNHLGTVRAFSINYEHESTTHNTKSATQVCVDTSLHSSFCFLGCVEGTPPMGEQSSKRNLNHFDVLVTFFVPGQDPQLSCSAVF